MTPAEDLPSLMDDTEFLAELEKVECPAPRASADRASRVALSSGFTNVRKPMPSASTCPANAGEINEVGSPSIEPVLTRDVDRWNIRPNPGSAESDPIVRKPRLVQIRAAVPLFLMMLIGICAGAASSALILHDRVARLIALWSH